MAPEVPVPDIAPEPDAPAGHTGSSCRMLGRREEARCTSSSVSENGSAYLGTMPPSRTQARATRTIKADSWGSNA